MERLKKILWFIKPRIYICKDVYLIRWLDYEFILKTNFKYKNVLYTYIKCYIKIKIIK